MAEPRKLTLKRDVLQELRSDELAAIAAGTRQTAYSCLDYISCFAWQCVRTLDGCIEA